MDVFRYTGGGGQGQRSHRRLAADPPVTPFCNRVTLTKPQLQTYYFSKIPHADCLHCRASPGTHSPRQMGAQSPCPGATSVVPSSLARFHFTSKGWVSFFPACKPGSVSFVTDGIPVKWSSRLLTLVITHVLFSHLPASLSPAVGPAPQHTGSLRAVLMKIENSDRIYNIEFKIWGVKKKKT